MKSAVEKWMKENTSAVLALLTLLRFCSDFAHAAPGITVYSDASGQQDNLGTAAVAMDKDSNIIRSRQICVGSVEYWSVYAAELMAIYYAISLVLQLAMTNNNSPITRHEPATILSDSMSAL